MSVSSAGLIAYGRCQCRCECTELAVIKARIWRGWWWRSRWVRVCLDCAPHLADQYRELGTLWRP